MDSLVMAGIDMVETIYRPGTYTNQQPTSVQIKLDISADIIANLIPAVPECLAFKHFTSSDGQHRVFILFRDTLKDGQKINFREEADRAVA